MEKNIDDIRRYWDRQPCNVNHSTQPQGSRQYFDEVETKKLTVEPHIVAFSEFEKYRGQRVLEVGCGIGTAGINFARYDVLYTGVELSQVSLDLAKRRFEVYGVEGDFYQGNAENLDQFLPAQTFDMIYCWGVVHHTPRPELVIKQMSQYLDSGGELKLMVYARNSWKNFMIEAGLDQPEAQWGCPIANVYSNQEITDLLDPYFEVEKICQDHIFPWEVSNYKQGVLVKESWFAHMPPAVFAALERNLGWHLMVTARRK